MSSDTKRSPPRGRKAVARSASGGVLFDDQARPQKVAQFPSGPRKAKKNEEAIPTSVYDTERDRALKPVSYDAEISDGGHLPAFLYVERGPGAGQLLPLRQGAVVIGRASLAELRLQHSSISRRHAQLTRVGERFYVKDLGSQNGTFINSQRIATEMEVQPGDEIALGNALLKLRGPLQPGDATQASEGSRPRKAAKGTLRVAIFAGAVGFGLAGAVMFALFRVPAATTASKPQLTPPPAVAMALEAPPVVTVEAEPEISLTVKPAAPIAAPSEPTRRSTSPSPATAIAKSKAAPKVTASKAPQSSPLKIKAPGALSKFEVGDVAGAIALAKSGGDQELAAKLERFKSSYEAATRALRANDGAMAIKNFEAALTLDEQLSGGWSKFSSEIRRELSNLWTLVGQSHAEKNNEPSARKAFELALKHDPSNARAKSQLSKLAPKATEKKAAARNAIDDAFDD